MKNVFLLLVLTSMVVGASGCGSGEAAGGDETTAVVRRDRFVVWVSARGKVVAESNVTIAPPRWWGLKISKIMVKEGDDVKKGDVLIELDTENLEEWARDVSRDIRSSEGARDSAQANLRSERDRLEALVSKARQDVAKAASAFEELKRLPIPTDLRNAEIDRTTAGKNADQAKVRYESMRQLYEKGGGVSLQQLEQRELEYRSAMTEHSRTSLVYQVTKAGATQAELREAKIRFELTELELQRAERTRDLTLAQLDESLKKAEGKLRLNRENLRRVERIMEECSIRAPVTGTVFYGRLWTHEGLEKIKEGMEVRPWHRLMELPDTTRMQLKVEVEEQDIGTVALEQPVRIHLDAYQQKKFTGKVTRIEHITKRKGGRESGGGESDREDLGTKVIEVVVTFNEQDAQIRTGLNGRAEIRTQQQAEGLVIPQKAVFSVSGRDVVYLLEGDQLVETPVKVGGRSDVDALVLDGVKEGDRVSLVAPKQRQSLGREER
ncbi:MAG TPA: efflux RND transporter periplasmic adaptor subunit [Planctomycetota bacterium]|nr:efflux RND transporter periplasmic adaptor subunit [Planctomycetota bacterium]